MKIVCRFANCDWTGDVKSLLNHCDAQHQKYVKDIQDGRYFNFSLENFLRDTFLLYDNRGIYWFLLDPDAYEAHIRRGIFEVGNSERYAYTVKLGGTNSASVAYLGPYETRSMTSKKYNIKLAYSHLEYFRGFIASKNVRIYFSETENIELGTSL